MPTISSTQPISMMLNVTRSQIIQRKWKVFCIAISFMTSLVKSSDSKVSDSSTTLLPEIQSEPTIDPVSTSNISHEIELIHELEPVSSNTSQQVPEIQHEPSIDHVSPSTSLEIEPVSSNTSPQDLEIGSVPSFLHEDTRGLSKQFRKLKELVINKDLEELSNFGGVVGVARFLKTDTEKGIVGDDLSKRRMMFGSNTCPEYHWCSLLHISKSNIIAIFIIMVCGISNMVFGFLISDSEEEGSFSGFCLFMTIFTMMSFEILKAIIKHKLLLQLQISNVGFDVLRNGQRQNVSITNLVVGDIVFLEVGNEVPTYGLFIDGQSLQVNEPSRTGKSDLVQVNLNNNPFLIHGSKVVSGSSKMLVTSAGTYISWAMYPCWEEKTPLQVRFDELTSYSTKIGILVALLQLTVQLLYLFIRKTKEDIGDVVNLEAYKKFHIVSSVFAIISQSAATLFVVDMDLDLACAVVLMKSLRHMSELPVKFRNKASCETMGAVTVICTNTAGTLTLNEMKVTKCYVGTEDIMQDFNQVVSKDLLELFYQGIAFNNMVKNTDSNSLLQNMDGPIEKAILTWADEYLGMEIDNMKRNYTTLHFESFNSHKKQSGVLIKSITKNSYYVHWKGAADMVVPACSRYYDSRGEPKEIDETKRSQLNSIIQGMASCGLKCIAFSQKNTDHKEMPSGEDEQVLSQNDLTLLGIIGMIHPCRPGAKEGIESCRIAGVHIKMITCDDVYTAKAIARTCGMLETNQQNNIDQVIQGIEFRNYTPEERLQKIDNIRVMARSTPEDKLLMVQCLKQKGHVVAITEDGTNDVRGLKEADVCLCMGTQETEVTKKFRDIVILDNDFSSVATVINRGRCSYINIQDFIEYKLTVAIPTIVITVIAAVSGNDIPLYVIQILFVELMGKITTVMASGRPVEDPVLTSPVGRTEPLITNIMWRNILALAVFQIVVQLAFLFNESIHDSEGMSTIIFSITVLCQFSNLFISSMIKKMNVYEMIRKNTLFLGCAGVYITGLVLFLQLTGKMLFEMMTLAQYGICFGIAGVIVPIRLGLEFVPVSKKPFLSYARDAYAWVLRYLS